MGTRPDSSIRIGPYRRPAFKTDNKSDHTRFPSFPSRSIHHLLLHYFRPFHFSQLILCLLFIPSFRSTSVFFTLLSRLILRMSAVEPPFRPREKLVERQKLFQSIHKHTYLKGPYDKITSVAIPLALAGSCLYMIGTGIYNMSHGIGKKE